MKKSANLGWSDFHDFYKHFEDRVESNKRKTQETIKDLRSGLAMRPSDKGPNASMRQVVEFHIQSVELNIELLELLTLGYMMLDRDILELKNAIRNLPR